MNRLNKPTATPEVEIRDDGRIITLRGEMLRTVELIAKEDGISPEEAVNQALLEAVARSKAARRN